MIHVYKSDSAGLRKALEIIRHLGTAHSMNFFERTMFQLIESVIMDAIIKAEV